MFAIGNRKRSYGGGRERLLEEIDHVPKERRIEREGERERISGGSKNDSRDEFRRSCFFPR